MRYIKAYENFFSIFPDGRYEDELAVNIAMSTILARFAKSRKLEFHENETSGWNISNGIDSFIYRVIDFKKLEQVVTIAVNHGSISLATLTVDSEDLKRTILSDVKTRFGIK